MNDQKFLFDCLPGRVSQYGSQISRKSDPETSKEAGGRVNVGEAKKLFLEGLRNCGIPSTANEVAIEFRSEMMQESIRKRAGELVKDGVIEVTGKRKCKQTGNSCQTYWFKRG